jgi:hypothetical protein
MSDLTAVFLMLAIFLGTGVCATLFFRITTRRCDEVATGVANGRPVSPKYRWLLLNDYLLIAFFPVGIFLTVAIGFFVTSRLVDDPDAKAFAQLCSALGAVGGIGNSLVIFGWMLNLRSILRQAEAD